MSLTKSLNGDMLTENDIDSLYEASLIAFNKNKEGKKFSEDELDVVEYKFFLREAFIYNCSQTEDGIEYLQNAKRLEITDIDRKSLRDYKGTN